MLAQPRVAGVEIYGARKVEQKKILAALAVKPGDALPASRGDVEGRLAEVEGVRRAKLEAFCCLGGQAILYVGVEESGAPAMAVNSEPEQELALPDDVMKAYREFAAALARATAEGDLSEDTSEGFPIMNNLAARMAQRRLPGLAGLNEDTLRDVLKHAREPEQRAAAAYLAGYAPSRRYVVDDLQLALRDPDPAVRANVMRSLRALARAGQAASAANWRVEPAWFLPLLGSIDLSDRLEAVRTLLEMAAQADAELSASQKERALPALVEMARWQYAGHAQPAFLLAGRLAGQSEAELQRAWAAGEREKVLAGLLKGAARK